jgi:hypothetical protein
MQTECNRDLFGFSRVEKRNVVASFDGGTVTSDAGGLLLGGPTDGSTWSNASRPASPITAAPI